MRETKNKNSKNINNMIPVWSTLLSDIGLASLCGVEGVISSLSSSLDDDDDDDDDAIGAFYVDKLFLSHKIKKHNVGSCCCPPLGPAPRGFIPSPELCPLFFFTPVVAIVTDAVQ